MDNDTASKRPKSIRKKRHGMSCIAKRFHLSWNIEVAPTASETSNYMYSWWKGKRKTNVSTLINKKNTKEKPNATSHILLSHSLSAALTLRERAEVEKSPTSKATESRSAHQKTDQTQLFHRALPLPFFLSPSALDTKMKQNAKPIGESTKIRQNAHDTQLSQTSQIRSCHRAISSITARPWQLVLCSRRARSFVFRMM